MFDIFIFILIVFILGIIPSYFYLKKKEKPNDGKPNYFMLISSITMLGISTFFSFAISQGSVGYIIGNVYIIPILMLGIFSLFKNSRNWKSRTRVIFYSSIFVLIASFGNFISFTQAI